MIPTVWVGNRLKLIISKNLWNSYAGDEHVSFFF